MRPWIGSLALLLISCNSSTTESDNVVGTTPYPENPAFTDFAPQASTDGLKQVFLSRRDAGAYRVYLYNESADPKLAPLAKSIPVDTGVDELATSLSDDGAWILTWRYGTEKNNLLINSFDAAEKYTWDIDTSSRLRDLTLAPAGQKYFAYTERKDGADTVRIYQFKPGTLDQSVAEASLSGEYGTQFAVSGSDIYAFTRKAATGGQVTVQYRKRSAGGTWDLQGETVTLSAADAAVPSSASALGLLYAKTLEATRLKAKVGTFEPAAGAEYQKNVGVAQEAAQFKGFSGTALDFSVESYRKLEPLTLGAISSTPDGAYILLSGYDAWFCKTRTVAYNLLVLVRTSDWAMLPLIPQRNTSSVDWTDAVSEPCSYFDQAPITQLKDFDVSVTNGQILSVSGSRVNLIYESKYTGDREIRRLSFDVTDWTTRALSNVVLTNISSNPRI